MEKNLKERLKAVACVAQEFWNEKNVTEIQNNWHGMAESSDLSDGHNMFITFTQFIRKVKYKSDTSKFRIGSSIMDKKTLFTYMIEKYSEFLVFYISAPEEIQIRVAKELFAFLRDYYNRRLKVLRLVLEIPDLVVDLDLNTSMLKELIIGEGRTLSYLNKRKAGPRKFLKFSCIYPMLTIMRLNEMKKSRRVDEVHDLLILANAPLFGNPRYEYEERERVRKYDDEALTWFKSL